MRKLAMVVFALVVSVAACGGSDGGSSIPPSGVSGTIQVTALTDADKAMLCDWFADQMGGYGAADTCTDPAIDLVSSPPDQASCIAEFPSCPVTVGQLESCFKLIIGAERACTQQAAATAFSNPDCQASADCFS